MSTLGLTVDGGVWSNTFAPPVTAYIPSGTVEAMPASTLTAPAPVVTAAPSAPSALSAHAVSDTAINLTWTRGDDSDAAIIVERGTVGGAGGYATLATLPAHSDTFTDTSCYPNTAYTYRVIASNSMGNSAPSPAQQATTLASQAILAAPGNVQATAMDPSTVTLTFADTNPSIARADLTVDPTSGLVVTSPGTPFTASETGKTLAVVGRSWWYLQVVPNSGGRIISDQHTAFNASDVGSTITIASGSGWLAGKYLISAVDASGHATLNMPATATGVTALGNARNGWSTGNYKILSVDGQGRATLATAPTYAGNTSRGAGSEGAAPGQAFYFIERSADGVSYQVVGDLTNRAALTSWTDRNLTAGATYDYRVRIDGFSLGLSDYTAPVSVTTPVRAAGAPADPTALSSLNNGPNSNTLTWTDNSGGTAVYKIERAIYSWSGTPAWTQIAVTSPGATAFTDTTVAAESFYYYRVRASNASGDSGYTTQVIARTSSPGIGAATVYEIGPGTAYPTLGSLDWSKLGPGDVVNILPNRDATGAIIPYHEKLLISVRGTAAAPIRIVGIPDPVTGAMPILDGLNAATAPEFTSHYAPLQAGSELLIGLRPQQSAWGWSPGYLTVSGLEIRGAYQGDHGGLTFTDATGKAQPYLAGAAGVYIEKGDNITITGCNIHGNGNGIFGAAQDDTRDVSEILIENDYIHDDGNPGLDRQHEIYMEGIDVTYQFNRIGPTHGGGSAIKDRSVGTVIRYNWIEGGGHELDLVEAQNQLARAVLMPAYHDTYVYGNVIFNPAPVNGGSSSIVHYGGDQGLTGAYRKGVLHFDDNTIVNYQSQPETWTTTLFKTDTPEETVDAQGNVIYSVSDIAGKPPAELDLLTGFGTGSFANDWVSPNIRTSFSAAPFTGVAAGASSLNTTGGTTPASVSIPGLIQFAASVLTDHPPTAQPVSVVTTSGRSYVIGVLSSASDPDKDKLTLASVTQPMHGTTTVNLDGTVTYRSTPGFSGTDSFNYIVADGRGGTALSSVTVTVLPASASASSSGMTPMSLVAPTYVPPGTTPLKA